MELTLVNDIADEPKDLTSLINAALAGDEESAEAAFAHTYPALCRLARLRLNPSARGSTLDTRSVVHESFLRFSRLGELAVEDRAHFYRYAGRVMRSVIVDLARQRGAARHGGGLQRVELSEQQQGPDNIDVLELHLALEQLAKHDPQMVHVVELKYFAGMSEADIAAAMGFTDRTVRRVWTRARVWLKAHLSGLDV
ncbi:MAG: ECF-type sigma factor [Lysobacterales bacterium]|jgi:RNA polymerase sigma factor (TIGR02999 family)